MSVDVTNNMGNSSRVNQTQELTKWFMNARKHAGVRHRPLTNAVVISLRFAKKCRRAIAGIQRTWMSIAACTKGVIIDSMIKCVRCRTAALRALAVDG